MWKDARQMKALLRVVFAIVLTAGAAMVPAFAQEVVGTLHVDDGTVMVSTGDKFNTAMPDQPLHVGDRVMVSDNGKATFTYNNGVVLHYESPGVYTVALAPVGTAVASTAGASSAGSVAIILGAALIGGLSLDSMDNVEPDSSPLSR
jgi:hypothetical protein